MGGEERLWGQREGKMNGIEMQDVKATKNKLKVKKTHLLIPALIIQIST